ncbi:uncharacterized protein PSFLO_07777 [Pseudozyma flocculosa]|uniref:Uncharacterized protein n=1 Tax=Pseudozyma flocculosa TaxID=84751 RepID=A0A5C3FCY0_9BASI|nr:uncharacterized protein PSFLO_07716 [Pseudozyma flocculosa]SPO42294.1 uncharacterized protein PSFLO_07777 [Pseudozyma flocculosa]
MAPRIQTFIDLYKNVDAVRRAKRYLQIKATKGDSRDNVELTALKYLMLVDHAVALDKKRSCQESNNRHMDCKKLTVNSYLLYKVVNNETFWLIPDVIFECEECTLNHYSCNVYFDMKDTNKTVLVNSKGIHGDFSVKRSGLANERKPAYDHPAHKEPIFGWSTKQIRDYIHRLRVRKEAEINEQIHRRKRDQQRDLNTSGGIVSLVTNRRDAIRVMSDHFSAFSTATSSLLDTLYAKRSSLTAAPLVPVVDKRLFDGYVDVSMAHPAVSVIRTCPNPTKAVLLLTDPAGHGNIIARWADDGKLLS